MSIDGAERRQDEFDKVLGALRTYSAKKEEYIKANNRLLNYAKKITMDEKKLLKGLKMEYFH